MLQIGLVHRGNENKMESMNELLDLFNGVYRKLIREDISKNVLDSPHSQFEHNVSSDQERIKSYIKQPDPVMMARFGSIELSAFVNYLSVTGKLGADASYSWLKYIQDRCFPKWFSLKTKHGMQNNAGFFPATASALKEWGKLCEEDLRDIDVLFSWQGYEKYLDLTNIATIPSSEMYFPYMFKNPWTECLKGRKVLVISPFAELVQEQYNNKRNKLFKDPRVLPEFKKLSTVKAYNVLRGQNPYQGIHSWFDALEHMERQIDEKDYDIALIGCGAYAFNLAAYIKRKGKTAITLCGSHEVLFGIYGTRYEKFLADEGILNENWVRPGGSLNQLVSKRLKMEHIGN